MKKIIFLKVYFSDENMLDTTFELFYRTEEEFTNRLIVECANILYQRGVMHSTITKIEYNYANKKNG